MTGMPQMADLAAMVAWAEQIMDRAPDFVIGHNYLQRWYVVPRNPWQNLYLHRILKSDDDRALHDHPWENRTLVLSGRYIEHLPGDRQLLRVAGDVVERSADAQHRLEVIPGEAAVTLFMTGPKLREWGFACPQGWVHWQDFTDPTDSSRTGRGCGEHDDPTPTTEPGHERAASIRLPDGVETVKTFGISVSATTRAMNAGGGLENPQDALDRSRSCLATVNRL